MSSNLTVVIPVYNGMPFLPEAVNSVLHQTYKDFKVLIVDDGSTDNSLEYLKSLTDSRVEIRQQKNLGFGNSLNRAISSINTEFIAHLDQLLISIKMMSHYLLGYRNRWISCYLIQTMISF